MVNCLMVWALKSVDELYEVIGGGRPSTSIPEYWDDDIPWITSADIAGVKDIQPRKKSPNMPLLIRLLALSQQVV